MQGYLAASRCIDFNDPAVADKSCELAAGAHSPLDVARRCFEFVRDRIKHSGDYKLNPVTLRASEVLRHGTGLCYAKSHLLAALLRANGIPAGLCYQRLSVAENGPPYCLHGLNAVHLRDYGWYRLDARGNKAGVRAEFCPPREVLAFNVREPVERALPGVWPEPMREVVVALTRYDDIASVVANLPDLPLADHGLVVKHDRARR